jgi:hypothetical protein
LHYQADGTQVPAHLQVSAYDIRAIRAGRGLFDNGRYCAFPNGIRNESVAV